MRSVKILNLQSMLRLSALTVMFLVSLTANAGYIVTGGTISHIYSTSGNQQVFGVEVVGGSGPCSSPTGYTILFPLSAAPDADTHKRAYAAAMMAMAMGLRVMIHNYSSDSCTGASYIDIYN